MDRQVNGLLYGWIVMRKDCYIDELLCEWKSGLTCEWIVIWMDCYLK